MAQSDAPQPRSRAEKSTQTTVDTIMFTRDEAKKWPVPWFQREVTENQNVLDLGESIKRDGGVLPGILTFGHLKGKAWLLDGQQRRQAFLLSERSEGFADIRNFFAETEADLAAEYIRLNSHLVGMKPDDLIKGQEPIYPLLGKIRKECPFVGYNQIRRGERSPIISMSVAIRSWMGSARDAPGPTGMSGQKMIPLLEDDETTNMIRFMKIAYAAWGPADEYKRLWSQVNLTLCMWLYRRIVLRAHSSKTRRIDDEQFTHCMMSLSASKEYLAYLVGRHMGKTDRGPTYSRIKHIVIGRLVADLGGRWQLPQPEWAK